MRNIHLVLALATTIFFILPLKLASQKVVTVTSGFPVIVISDDGSYKVCIEGLTDKNEADRLVASLAKKGIKGNINTKSTAKPKKTITIASDKVARIIKYGPWRMQNKLKVLTDSIANILSFGPGRAMIEPNGNGGRVRQITKIYKSDQPSILKLYQNAQISVLKGQQYSIQVGRFAYDKSAFSATQKVSAITSLPVIVVIQNGYYHLLIEGFANLKEANLFIGQLARIGYKGTIVKVNELADERQNRK